MTAPGRRVVAGTLLLLAYLATPATGHGSLGSADFYDYEIDQRVKVPAFEAIEVSFDVKKGDTFRWEVTAPAERPVYVELHRQAPNGTTDDLFMSPATTHENGSGEAPERAVYSLLVSRDDFSSARVRLELEGYMAVVKADGFTLQRTLPAPPAVAIPLLLLAFMALASPRRKSSR